jgi:iron complex outermembrane receptor protein
VWNIPSLTAPSGVVPTPLTQSESNAHVLARHEWRLGGGSEASLQAYLDHYSQRIPGQIGENRNTLDLDFQHRILFDGAHDVVWGLGYRESHDRVTSGSVLTFAEPKRTLRLASIFVQDDILLQPDALRLVLGGRLEHNDYTGLEFQPNARLLWTPTPRATFWGAASRAVRTPARAEQDAAFVTQVIPANPPVPAILVQGMTPPAGELRSEIVNAFELGYRQQFDDKVSLDVTAFSNRYSQLRGGATLTPYFDLTPVPHLVQPVLTDYSVRARTHGFEAAIDWRVSPTWRIQPAYSYMVIRAHAVNADPAAMGSAALYDVSAPRQQLSLRSSWTLRDRSQFDVWLRHVGRLPAASPGSSGIAAYTTLDLRYAWRPHPGFELSIVGQNLLHRSHAEFVPDFLPSQQLAVQRSLYVKAKWQF